ncbi:MAG TPA: hypothetical protein DCZ75_03650 [Geobacter sp.]|nr:hypothetical protein [Geobacter sp.]
MGRRATLLLPILLLAAQAALGAPPAPRPLSGSGVLTLRGGTEPESAPLPIYDEPGVLRLAERRAGQLPRLSGSDQEPQLAASARKGGWTRVAYDEAGREGWLEPSRGRIYLSWEEFLPGRTVRLLPGMKKGLYQLRSAPDDKAPPLSTLPRERELQLLGVDEEWARVKSPQGWVRWRDGDGRLTISLTGSDGEKR